MTYQPPQNILAAILQTRKQGAYNDPGVAFQPVQAPQTNLPQSKPPIDPMTIINGLFGSKGGESAPNGMSGAAGGTADPMSGQQNSALAQLTSQQMQQIPGSQPPANAFAQLTGLGNPNQSNATNAMQYLSKLFGGQ